MNENQAKFLNRLETTKIPTIISQLRGVDSDGRECMCSLGHLVDLWIEQTPGAHWVSGNPSRYFDPIENELAGFPSDQMLIQFGLSPSDAPRIYRQNDHYQKSPAEVAQFIREELI